MIRTDPSRRASRGLSLLLAASVIPTLGGCYSASRAREEARQDALGTARSVATALTEAARDGTLTRAEVRQIMRPGGGAYSWMRSGGGDLGEFTIGVIAIIGGPFGNSEDFRCFVLSQPEGSTAASAFTVAELPKCPLALQGGGGEVTPERK